MWNLNQNKISAFICYFVYGWCRGKNSKFFWGETSAMLEVHIHFFYLGIWRGVFRKFPQQIEHFSSNSKIYCWLLSRNNIVLDANIKLLVVEIMTDLVVKHTTTHSFFDSSISHPYHCKKEVPFTLALRLNRICLENESFDRRCNNLDNWLIGRG